MLITRTPLDIDSNATFTRGVSLQSMAPDPVSGGPNCAGSYDASCTNLEQGSEGRGPPALYFPFIGQALQGDACRRI
jgi:hypothetical protein